MNKKISKLKDWIYGQKQNFHAIGMNLKKPNEFIIQATNLANAAWKQQKSAMVYQTKMIPLLSTINTTFSELQS
ncbi:hypothetical protein EWB00_010157, partial [Schistosoma japonicum]